MGEKENNGFLLEPLVDSPGEKMSGKRVRNETIDKALVNFNEAKSGDSSICQQSLLS